jgi:hypothetical protein
VIRASGNYADWRLPICTGTTRETAGRGRTPCSNTTWRQTPTLLAIAGIPVAPTPSSTDTRARSRRSRRGALCSVRRAPAAPQRPGALRGWGASTHPARSTACSPVQVADQGSPATRKTEACLPAEPQLAGRGRDTVRVAVPVFGLQQSVDTHRQPRSRVGRTVLQPALLRADLTAPVSCGAAVPFAVHIYWARRANSVADRLAKRPRRPLLARCDCADDFAAFGADRATSSRPCRPCRPCRRRRRPCRAARRRSLRSSGCSWRSRRRFAARSA